MKKRCFYLCYRRKHSRRSIDWTRPTGGLVMEADGYVYGYPICDFQLASDVLHQRYHCGPGEALIIAEVLEKEERSIAKRLHLRWEQDMADFHDLMECADSA